MAAALSAVPLLEVALNSDKHAAPNFDAGGPQLQGRRCGTELQMVRVNEIRSREIEGHRS
jgi:hypothetical protein